MAYVEEITPDKPIQDYPEHLLFTIPNNWNLHIDFDNESKTLSIEISHGHWANYPVEEFTTCYVKEEVSCHVDEKADPPSGSPHEEAAQNDKQKPHQVNNANEGKEEKYAQWSFPIASVQEKWQDQPPFINPGYLELIFETRRMVDDQIFRTIQINQRFDMLYTANSRTPPRRQCPTCMQTYAIPVGWWKNGEEEETTG